MACYPLLLCVDWAALGADLDDLAPDLVSVTAVIDPFSGCDEAKLRGYFRDVVRLFKQAFVVDLDRKPDLPVSVHHRRNVRRALERVQVERADEPGMLAAEWIALYGHLVRRHGISGIAAFSPRALADQLAVPGTVLFRAHVDGDAVGMIVWYVRGAVAYYHLGAYSPLGYRLGASFALFQTAIEHFREAGLKQLSLGAGAGVSGAADDGLSRFKRGWATGTRPVYLCGRILDAEAYATLAARAGGSGGYFPAYRRGEFRDPARPASSREP
jgi:hypothetical protein